MLIENVRIIKKNQFICLIKLDKFFFVVIKINKRLNAFIV